MLLQKTTFFCVKFVLLVISRTHLIGHIEQWYMFSFSLKDMKDISHL